jgi:FKBP-type peptidyl-prolyl cis-trans isomerase SlyD
MKIADDKVVGIHYTLKDSDGTTIDSSEGRDPLYYLHGYGQLVPGLEDELEDKALNEKFNLKVKPEDAYGEYNKELVYVLDKSKFPDPEKVEIGMTFTSKTKEGEFNLNVINVEGDNVTLDANHPLAGRELDFDVEVVEIRDATKEEIDHEHVHGANGHQH